MKPTYLVDANLPYYFDLWNSPRFIHVNDLNDTWTDEEIWDYARQNNLIIISKDADFSNKIIVKTPPPKVIQIKLGNLKIRDLHKFLSDIWPTIEKKIKKFKIIYVYKDKIEGIK
jgi:predicted nuclease of predicted toxin-antitoxin system